MNSLASTQAVVVPSPAESFVLLATCKRTKSEENLCHLLNLSSTSYDTALLLVLRTVKKLQCGAYEGYNNKVRISV